MVMLTTRVDNDTTAMNVEPILAESRKKEKKQRTRESVYVYNIAGNQVLFFIRARVLAYRNTFSFFAT